MSSELGELWIPPHFCIEMSTAISWHWTAEGLAIASDGRCRDHNGYIKSDNVQKIFPIQQVNGQLAYALAGTMQIGESVDQVAFDFDHAIREVLAQMSHSTTNWFTYLERVRLGLERPLAQARSCTPLDKTDAVTYIFIGGMFGKHAKGAHIRFEHGATQSTSETGAHRPGFNVRWGSKPVYDLVDGGDSRFYKFTEPKLDRIRSLATAVERVRNDILSQCDPEALQIEEETCAGIGGRVQIATITLSDSFCWVPGFEPVTS
jgi:hypothetical protein